MPSQALKTWRKLISNSIKYGNKSIIPEQALEDVCQSYKLMKLEDKRHFMTSLARMGYLNKRNLDFPNANFNLINTSSANSINKLQSYRSRLQPDYQPLITACGRTSLGLKFIMDLRQDCRKERTADIARASATLTLDHEEEKQWLKILETDLSLNLNNWFSAGLASISRVTWGDSSAELLENLCSFEQVHQFTSIKDMKNRLDLIDRRVFTYCHPVTGENEPLVILYVALTSEISKSVDELKKTDRQIEKSNKSSKKFTTAIFYSISSRGNQIGLQGIDLGNQMIKQAVLELKKELPHLTTFSTLSPIPGFTKWLKVLRNNDQFWSDRENCEKFLNGREKILELMEVQKTVNEELEFEENLTNFITENKTLLEKLLVQYLYNTKRRQFAANPVCNFHLKNGAQLYRINFMADSSAKGLGESLGFMANYVYNLSEIDENSFRYQVFYEVNVSEEVLEFLK